MKQRSYYFDNAKFILIVFVVFGHLLRTFIEDNETLYAIYNTIYSFHMPAFILVSGFFAKGFNKKGYIKKLTTKLIVPYLIFQIIYTIYYYFLFENSHLLVDPLNPNWALWFLLSLFFWNIMLFAYSKFRPATGILIAVLVALLVGYVDSVSNYLSLSRTFVFFPFFLLGYHLKKEHFEKVTTIKGKALALIAFSLTFIWYFSFPEIDNKWILGSKPYAELGEVTFISMFKRLGVMLLNTGMIFSFMALVPKGRYFFTRWGTQTLYVYLLHGFFVRTFRFTSINEYFSTTESYILLAGISLLITILLSSKIVTSITQPIIELKWQKTKQLVYRSLGFFSFYRQKMQRLIRN